MVAVERFIEYLTFKGLKPTHIEKTLGFSNGYLGKMRNNKASIGSDVLEKILYSFPDINSEWLLTGRGDMLKPEAPAVPTVEPSTPVQDAHIYNVYGLLEKKDAIIREKDAEIKELHTEINRLNRENGILHGQLKKPTDVHIPKLFSSVQEYVIS